MELKVKVQRWILFISVLLMGGKFIAYLLTSSVGILTDATESIVNVVAEAVSLISITMAVKPRDREHPFGHGKFELLSASLEGLLIVIAGLVIIYEGAKRLLAPEMPQRLDIGIWIVALAGLVNFIMGAYCVRIGKKNNSMALIAGGKHLQSDTYSTIGLVLGLLILHFTKIAWIDSALALIFGSIIIYTGISILRKTLSNLVDSADKQSLEIVARLVDKHKQPNWIDVHNLKIIRYGNSAFIDCDLTLPWFFNIEEGHSECEKLRNVLNSGFSSDVIISIHADSCQKLHCEHCSQGGCNSRQCEYRMSHQFTVGNMTDDDAENLKD